jgi:hypothetical protein
MKKGACVWCHAIVNLGDDYNPKDRKKDCVCSKECAVKEREFRVNCSDEQIGLRNYRDYGVNPNHRGRHGKKESS